MGKAVAHDVERAQSRRRTKPSTLELIFAAGLALFVARPVHAEIWEFTFTGVADVFQVDCAPSIGLCDGDPVTMSVTFFVDGDLPEDIIRVRFGPGHPNNSLTVEFGGFVLDHTMDVLRLDGEEFIMEFFGPENPGDICFIGALAVFGSGLEFEGLCTGGEILDPTNASAFVTWDDSSLVMAPNLPPVANAGGDRSIRAGDTVSLDGSGSSDDNLASDELAYFWTLTTPPDSDAILLSHHVLDLFPHLTIDPHFVADVPGIYIAELVVTDEFGQDSAPNAATISSANLAPTADAGADQLVFVDETVVLDGSASIDPEDDPITFAWTIDVAPEGSAAVLNAATSQAPDLIPDVQGTYRIVLVVSDPIGPGAPDTVEIVATLAEDFATEEIVLAAQIVESLAGESGEVTNQGNQQAFENLLIQASAAIADGDIDEAIAKLEQAIRRTDGCSLRGAPDTNGSGRDWITDCAAQADIYDALTAALGALET